MTHAAKERKRRRFPVGAPVGFRRNSDEGWRLGTVVHRGWDVVFIRHEAGPFDNGQSVVNYENVVTVQVALASDAAERLGTPA